MIPLIRVWDSQRDFGAADYLSELKAEVEIFARVRQPNWYADLC
jgi:hypothetical protein